MGLLDFLGTDEGRLGLGLLAAAGPRSDGMGAGGRIQEAFSGQDAYKKARSQDEYKRLQMDELKRGFEQETQKAAEAQRVRGLVATAGNPGQPINYQSLLQQGVPYELVKQLADSQNLGRAKVARTAEIEGPNGAKLVQGFDDYGQAVGQGAAGYVAPQLINQGDRQTFAKPTTGASFPVGMSPSERDSSARGWAGNSLARERLNFDKAGGAEGVGSQKAPAGYRWKADGSLEAVPGGPADIKAGELGAKRETQQQGAALQADRIINKVDQAVKKVGYNTAGAGGSVMGWLPGSESTDLAGDLETIKANLGFAELQAMRAASPTGGALGQVAVQELIALQSTVASLDKAQSPGQLKARLKEVRTHYENWKKTLQPDEGGAPKSPAMAKLPTANASNKGRRIRDTETGKTLVSNGMSWTAE